jgi:DnaK suppressor protein
MTYVPPDVGMPLHKLQKFRATRKQIFSCLLRPICDMQVNESEATKECIPVTLSPQDLRRLEEKLRQQARAIERSMLTAVEQGRQAMADETQDVADQAVNAYQKEMLFSQGTNGHGQLSLVRLALDRLREGTYGECIACGNTIGEKRLEALPWTPYCIECQEKIEKGQLEPVASRRVA